VIRFRRNFRLSSNGPAPTSRAAYFGPEPNLAFRQKGQRQLATSVPENGISQCRKQLSRDALDTMIHGQ